MRILLTGGAGYLGGEAGWALLEAGHSVVSVDRLRPAWAGRLAGLPVTFVQADVLEPEELRPHLRGVDALVHLAALSSDRACAERPELVDALNAVAPARLARVALEEGVRRFVLASTCAVYGEGQELTEDSPCRPLTPYAASKARAEQRLLDLRGDGLDPVVLRLGTLFGRALTPRRDLVVNAMAHDAVTRGRVRVNGSGRQWRPLVHVSDAAAVFRWAAARADGDVAEPAVLNVAAPDGHHRVVQIAEHVARRLPGTVVVRTGAPDLDEGYTVNASRIVRALPLRSWTSLADGVEPLLREAGEPSASIPAPRRATGTPIALAVPDITAADERAVVRVLRSGWLTRGRHADEFEARLREVTGARHVVAVSSCTAALHLALLAAGVGPGDEVITTPLTWPATANVVEHVGAVPVFADVDPTTLNLDPRSVAERVGARTRAILPVHMAGLPADLTALRAVADRCGAVLVEDAAHALGARYDGRPVGGTSSFACFSFYPTKSITTIDGGAVTCDDEDAARRIRILANHGMSSTAWAARNGGSAGVPECLAPGFKYNVSDVAAALGVQQLRRLPAYVETRRRLVQRYRRRLADVPGVTLLDQGGGRFGSSYHLMPVLLDDDGSAGRRRDRVAEVLRAAGIGTGVHYRSLHLQPYYRERYGLAPDSAPVAAGLSGRLLSLPLHCRMRSGDVDVVVAGLVTALREVDRAGRSAMAAS